MVVFRLAIASRDGDVALLQGATKNQCLVVQALGYLDKV
jgi:hypothetical protein